MQQEALEVGMEMSQHFPSSLMFTNFTAQEAMEMYNVEKVFILLSAVEGVD